METCRLDRVKKMARGAIYPLLLITILRASIEMMEAFGIIAAQLGWSAAEEALAALSGETGE